MDSLGSISMSVKGRGSVTVYNSPSKVPNISLVDAKFLLDAPSPKAVTPRVDQQQKDLYQAEKLLSAATVKSDAFFNIDSSERIPYFKVAWLLIKSALPSLIQGITANIAFTTLIYFVSLKGDTHLIGAVGMGSTLFFTGIIAFLQALNIGLSSLGSQAFGAKNPRLLTIYFKRALLIQLIVYLPLALLVSQIAELFKLIGFAAKLSDGIEKVLLAMMPAAIPFFYFDAAKNYLISQKIFAPQGYIQLVSSVFDILMQYLLIIYLDMGIIGIGIARFSMETCRATIIFLYIRYSRRVKKVQVVGNPYKFKKLWIQFKYQITAGALQITDLVGTQIVLLQAAYFSQEEVAANVIVTRVTKFCLIWALSLGVALGSYVGNAMGEQNEKKIRAFIKVGIFLDCLLIIFIWTLIWTQAHHVGAIFSKEQAVQDHVTGLLLFFMLISPFDNLQNVLGGILRNVGKEKFSTRLYMFTYYPIAIPLSIILAHWAGMRLYGLYGAMLVAKALNTLGSVYFLCTTNLKEQMLYVANRIVEEFVPPIKEDPIPMSGFPITTNFELQDRQDQNHEEQEEQQEQVENIVENGLEVNVAL